MTQKVYTGFFQSCLPLASYRGWRFLTLSLEQWCQDSHTNHLPHRTSNGFQQSMLPLWYMLVYVHTAVNIPIPRLKNDIQQYWQIRNFGISEFLANQNFWQIRIFGKSEFLPNFALDTKMGKNFATLILDSKINLATIPTLNLILGNLVATRGQKTRKWGCL